MPRSLLSHYSGFYPPALADVFDTRAEGAPGRSHQNSFSTPRKPITPTFSPLSLHASHKHSLGSPIRSGRALQVLTQFWTHRLAPTRSCSSCCPAPLHPLPASKLCKMGPQPLNEPRARKDSLVTWKRARRPIYKPFYLSTCKRRETCSGVWLTLSHPPPTYNNQVSPHFPPERST